MCPFIKNSLFIHSCFILNHLVSFRHVQGDSKDFRSKVSHGNNGHTPCNEFDVLFEVIEGVPSNPIHQLRTWNIHVIIKPENNILSPTKFNLSDINVRVFIFFLNLTDEKFSSCSEEYDILLIFHFWARSCKLFHISSSNRVNMKPKLTFEFVWS